MFTLLLSIADIIDDANCFRALGILLKYAISIAKLDL